MCIIYNQISSVCITQGYLFLYPDTSFDTRAVSRSLKQGNDGCCSGLPTEGSAFCFDVLQTILRFYSP